MVNMNNSLKRFIEKNIELIELEEIEKLYELIENESPEKYGFESVNGKYIKEFNIVVDEVKNA